MALFKPLKGSRTSLDAQPLREGYAYFCVDDGSFHIDYMDSEGTLRRKQINAQEAEKLTGFDINTVMNNSDAEIPTSKAVFTVLEEHNGSAEAHSDIRELIAELDETKADASSLSGFYTKDEIDTKLESIDVDYTETDPTVPAWAKEANKPTYTASEVGALPLSGGTMTGGIAIGQGDGNGIQLGKNGYINGTTGDGANDTATIVGLVESAQRALIGHTAFSLMMRGSGANPTYNGTNVSLEGHSHNVYVATSGDTMTGALVAQNNANYTTKQVRNIFLVADGEALPAGANGDICLVYTP